MNIHFTPPATPYPALWATAWGEDAYGFWQAFALNGIQQVMRWIPAGEFLMGSPEDEAERYSDESQHRVVIEKGFWLADTACTQELWQAVMGENPSHFKNDPQNPVEKVSWDDCQVFITKANALLGESWLTLPSEAAWEYACRAGTQTPFWFGETISTKQANFDGNSPYAGAEKEIYRKKTVPVVSFAPNPWGLYQVHGNVWEWCEDFDQFDSDRRVLRGGCWLDSARCLRSAHRGAYSPDVRYGGVGLRLAGVFDPQTR